MASSFVVCPPVPAQVPVRKPEASVDDTQPVPPVRRPVTITQFSRRITIIRKIDVTPAARVPVPSAPVPVTILVVADPPITDS